MANKTQITLISLLSVVLLGAIGYIVYLTMQHNTTKQEMVEMVEQMTYEKEQLEEEYADVALEMEGFSFKINNDSLLNLVTKEQQRVQLLLEELRTVKATNARRINELKNELASVRKVLVYYVEQVDSLSAINEKLENENRVVYEKYQTASREATTLAEEKQKLEHKVTIASQLESRNIAVELQSDNGRKVRRLRYVSIIKVSFDIMKNNTASVGKKTVYMRIQTPDDNVLQKQSSDVFSFENREIAYSARKTIEYTGEELSDVLYYTVTETLWAGDYRVDIFADGHLLGSQNFTIAK
ncbi:MAG: hypothetical protein R3Y59_04105 [bacterium]